MTTAAATKERILMLDSDVTLIRDAGLYHEIESMVNRSVKKNTPDGRLCHDTDEVHDGERYKFYAAYGEAKAIMETRKRIAEAQALKVGDGITKHGYTDAHAYTIIAIKPHKLGTILIAQRDKTEMLNRHELTFHPGGFVGHYSDQYKQQHSYESNPNGEILKVRIKPNGHLVGVGDGRNQDWSIGRHEFYDLNF